ncbi:hypothetical protein FRUB_04664 [Fimbriiglobus ruber]|uniref:Uncharacterized protein n=1 Tax=Fimbriiglobus ruber TaxID=1908690 RepID=A0A225DH60_9BACT|nr:hypothetical protein FRUB_04664 [Fimbriiglobus ruber]
MVASSFPLPWSHHVQLLTVPNLAARRFYEEEAIRGGPPVRQTGNFKGERGMSVP